MSTAEINEDSTKEEIEQYAEEVVKEVQEAQRGDDARITSEHADNVHTPVEKSDSDDTVVTDENADETWITEDLKAEVAAYGIDEAELGQFANREELNRALQLFDKTALEAGRKAMAEEEEPARNEKGQFERREPEEAQEGEYKVSLSEEYDEEIVGEFARMRDYYDSRLQALEARFLEADAKMEEQHFDHMVDSMGHADLFGKTGKENSKQLQRRQDLHVAVKAQQLGLAQLGRPVDLDEALVNRVARMVFAEDLGKKDLKNRTRRIAEQSDGRQGGGATRPQDPREDPRDWADRVFREKEGR